MEQERVLSDFPSNRLPADCWEVANWIFQQAPGDGGYNSTLLATRAARLMKAARWGFVEYCSSTGEERWAPPPCPYCGESLFEQPCRFDGRDAVCRECGELIWKGS